MLRKKLSFLFLFLLALVTLSCSNTSNKAANQTNIVANQGNSPTNQSVVAQSTIVKPTVMATPLPTPKKEGVVSLEAGLVFQSGDSKPVARTTFYLLDESAIKLMRKAGVKSSQGGDNSDLSIAGAYGISSKFDNNPSANAANELIKKHSLQSVTTDFGGKAKFNPVAQGTYYLFGISSTPKGFAVWDMKIDLNSAETSVTLDQNNAAVAL